MTIGPLALLAAIALAPAQESRTADDPLAAFQGT